MSRRTRSVLEPTLDPNGTCDDLRHVEWGNYLTKKEVGFLEKGLRSQPDDLRARLQLIGYYQQKDRGANLWRHVFWMIEKRASDWFCYYLPVPRPTSVKTTELVKKLWRAQVSKHARDWRVLCSAANHLNHIDEQLSISLFKRALKLQPSYGLPARRLAQYYRSKVINGPQPLRSSNARLAFEYAELALRLKDSLGEKVGVLIEFTWVAVRERRLELARKWARRLMNIYRRHEVPMSHWEQYAYVYLAAVDLAAGKNSLCIRNLNKLMTCFVFRPTHVIDNPTLLSVLSELFGRGERDAVFQFVDAAESVPMRGEGKINWPRFREELEAGIFVRHEFWVNQ